MELFPQKIKIAQCAAHHAICGYHQICSSSTWTWYLEIPCQLLNCQNIAAYALGLAFLFNLNRFTSALD